MRMDGSKNIIQNSLSVFLFDIYINIYIASEQANRYHFGSV